MITPPPPDRDVSGRAYLGVFRIRPTLFGCRIEEQIEEQDGTRKWVRPLLPVTIQLTKETS
jgi:hypothetical protein